MRRSLRRRIVVAGPLPPPFNGFSYVTREMAALLAETCDVERIDLSPHLGDRGVDYHVRRLWLVGRAVARLLAAPRVLGDAFYVGCDGGLGLAYTALLSLLARLRGYDVYIHHHSYAYINVWRPLMAILLLVTGSKATHICLCETMAAALSERYRRTLKVVVVSNAAFVPPPQEASLCPSGPLRIGLLSNLDDNKGLDVFLELAGRAVGSGLDVTAVLAGPPASEASRRAIERARATLGKDLDYRGAVYDAAKQQFFRDVDVFVFPTRYVNEAQPAVIFEALSYGIPVLTIDRGCIRTQVGAFGEVMSQGEDFVTRALASLTRYLGDRGALAQRRRDIESSYRERSARARQAAIDLFDAPPPLRPGTP